MDTASRVYRSRDSYIGGVCAGIAERYDCDPIVVRILFVLVALASFGLGGIAYIIMWIAMPLAPSARVPYDVEPESVQSSTYGSVDCARVRGRTVDELAEKYHDEGIRTPIRIAMAVGLLLLFLVLSNLVCPFVKGTYWWQYWPAVLIIVGFTLIVVPIAREQSVFWHVGGAVLVAFGYMIMPMSLGFYSPQTLVNSVTALWPVLVLVLALFVAGVHRDVSPLALLGLMLFVAFCIVTLTSFGVPGYMDDLVLLAPDGNPLVLRGPGL